jgi:hypothetical protein
MLGLDSRFAVDEFMKQHGIPMPYDSDDLQRDSENLSTLRSACSR